MTQIAVVDQLSEVSQMCRGCPLQTMSQAYVNAARQLCDKSYWLVRTLDFDTVIDQPVYLLDLTPDTEHEVVGIRSMALDTTNDGLGWKVLTDTFSGGWDPSNETDSPECYQYLPGGYMALQPTPNGVWHVRTTVALQPVRGAANVDSTLVQVWGDALQSGALAWLLALPATPWTDKAQANRQFELFRAAMNQAISSTARGYNGGAEATDRYGRPAGAVRTRILPI